MILNNISKIERKTDGSYVITKNEMPYHIPYNEEYRQEYEELEKYISENNIDVTEYVEPEFQRINTNSEETIRIKRDSLLNEADIVLLKFEEQVELGVIEQDDAYRLAILQYKEALRNIPEQEGFPENVVWPELPARV